MVRGSLTLAHGAATVPLAPAQVAVVSLMRNAAFYIDDFIRHHQALGVRHIVIVDNASSDDTVARAKRFADVTVLQSDLPAKRFECALREQAARKVLRGGWVLFVDSDELFEPLGTLPQLMHYLESEGYTAMVTQMLDLYAPGAYGEGKGWGYGEILVRADHYSLGVMQSVPYFDREEIGFSWYLQSNHCDAPLQLKLGGLRREVFGEACFLSKHSLVKMSPEVRLIPHPHCASNVRIADVTGLLRHYKLTGDYLARDRASVAAGTWDHAEDARRLAAATGGDAFAIRPDAPQVYAGVGPLLDQGFVYASDRYRDFIG
ncbi:glycosyltransferase family 2 protein [Pseudorhodobacter sp.]|uniref:glycosyltransferase family 2 protein n=1 Tax=Pseudorhodobacter sp. TaxID=1934400 RepID=UPI002649BAA1|nr:glycosyltransferase family 2 protein [Pseudorhodobacter sp.]